MTEPHLSPRQRECLLLVYERLTSKEISLRTGLSRGTIDTYISEAVSVLGARNRRHAAEIVHSAERLQDDPGKIELEKTGLNIHPPRLFGRARDVMEQFAEWLPLRVKGASGNDLNKLYRFAWIVQLAIALAAGFGMLVVGLEVVSHFYGKP